MCLGGGDYGRGRAPGPEDHRRQIQDPDQRQEGYGGLPHQTAGVYFYFILNNIY